ncbi:MAG: tRNA (5-methylaminomethyl-2-thiouridine)(34)-methyltransferase MnmD [Balneolaceae bacterium]|nr:tRNA (5-methylaminomethyl-2-thiouridine)(34)-methyltransferase MnmD [Balneolaceae bacterium]
MTEPSGNAQPDLKITADGSHTLYSRRYHQTYHSPSGAVTESRHVFFEKSGLLDRLKTDQPLTLFETGFGTGLNFLLLLDYYQQFNCSSEIRYHSVEANPISATQVQKLNYADQIQHSDTFDHLVDLFEKLKGGDNQFHPLPGVKLQLYVGYFDDYDPDETVVDMVFHDPFSPEVNPELWTETVFAKLRAMSRPTAMLTTYCAASGARAAMAAAGWKVAREEGAPGKREMTLASPDAGRLGDLERVNEERLVRRYRNGEFG